MKALSNLKLVLDQSVLLGIMALVLLTPMLYPQLAMADTSGQSAAIFKINVADANLLNPNPNTDQNSLNINTVQQADPLTVNLQAYLQARDSPLANYVPQLITKDNWPMVISISFVESDMCQRNLYYNCSGIGGQQYLRKYNNFGEWINDMSTLLDTRYNGWSLDKMDGVYVQPYSSNWRYGSKKILAELTQIQQTSDQQRVAMAQSSIATATANQQLATIAQ